MADFYLLNLFWRTDSKWYVESKDGQICNGYFFLKYAIIFQSHFTKSLGVYSMATNSNIICSPYSQETTR